MDDEAQRTLIGELAGRGFGKTRAGAQWGVGTAARGAGGRDARGAADRLLLMAGA